MADLPIVEQEAPFVRDILDLHPQVRVAPKVNDFWIPHSNNAACVCNGAAPQQDRAGRVR